MGRRTVSPNYVILRYITLDGKILVFPQKDSMPDWLLNIRTNREVRVHGEGRIIDGTARLKRAIGLDDPALQTFTRKYGRQVVTGKYWGQMSYVEIQPVNVSQVYDYDELIYGDLEAAFDGVAQDYDRHIFGNPVNLWLRNRSLGVMSKLFRSGDTVLEVGCGTGTETVSLAKMGVKVVATDISSKMLEVLRKHAKDASVEDLIVPIHCRPYQLKNKLQEHGYSKVSGAYSTYGAVNTEPRLGELFQNLHALIESTGRLVLGIWNKYCLYELFGYMLKANPKMALARLKNPVPVGKSRFCVSTNAYSVESLTEAMKDEFTLERVYGVGILLPPSNLIRFLPQEPLLSVAKGFEVRFGSSYPWNRLGDHFLGVYKKNA